MTRLETVLDFASAGVALSLALGAFLLTKRSYNRWTIGAGMAFLAAERLCSGFYTIAGSAETALAWQMGRLTAFALAPAIWLIFSLSYARANALIFLRKWQWILGGALVVPIVLFTALRTSLVTSSEIVGGLTFYRFGLGGSVFYLLTLLTSILVLVNLEHTYRAAVGTARWRIKFMLLGVGVIFIVRLFTASQSLLFRRIDPSLDILHSGALIVASILIVRSLFRTGHFAMDVHPSHSVLQGSVTILLIGVYLLIVAGLARIVAYIGGDSSFAAKALLVLVLLVILAVLLQSDRVRAHLRRFVSRHFQRPTHDYRAIWQKFTAGTASRVEQTEYCRAVVKLMAEIFETLSVSFWLVSDRGETLSLAASTGMSENQAAQVRPDATETALILAFFRHHGEPIDIEHVNDRWAEVLRRCHPDQFHKGGTRVCAPIASGGEVLGILLIGDRVAGAPFIEQDYDLLKSLADQAASGLLNARFSQRLLQAREHEAFQTMATFFVHDLKNAASTLNLMLQNLPDHFDDPEFRADALRGVGKSVSHINHLISRLGQLRSELKIVATPADLNQLAAEAAAAFATDKDFHVETTFAPLDPLPLDKDQFGKVITNLLLNAREAGATVLQLTTTKSGQWAILEAADNGKGMPPEFLARSLFRPFQTTKKSGLGIGMFQSKMIIEAHGGKITVESHLRTGTTFRVFLPTTPLL